MLLATASIGRKLLLSFIAMAMLVMLSALIGVSGFRWWQNRKERGRCRDPRHDRSATSLGIEYSNHFIGANAL